MADNSTPPPTYALAVSRDPWALIAPHVRSADLFSVTLVSRKFNEIFAPRLWGEPTSQCEADEEAVHGTCTQVFLRTQANQISELLCKLLQSLPRTREMVKTLTHTLRIPSTGYSTYGVNNTEYLQTFLEHLPGLKVLLANGVSTIDYYTLSTLRPTESLYSPLELLSIANCENLSATGLAEALEYLQHLVYIDLSNSKNTLSNRVLLLIGNLVNLRVLKLRGTDMSDTNFKVLTMALNDHLRVLDIRDNYLTDRSAIDFNGLRYSRHSTCPHQQPFCVRSGSCPYEFALEEDPFDYELDTSDIDCDAYSASRVAHLVTANPRQHENPIDNGLTHLWISGNKFDSEGVVQFINCCFLKVIDAGNSPLTFYHTHATGTSVARKEKYTESEFLRLGDHTYFALSYLRVHHIVITQQLSFSGELDLRAFRSNWYKELSDRGQQRFWRNVSELIRCKPLTSSSVTLSMMPQLRTLVLTNIPRKVPTDEIPKSLVELIYECSQRQSLAQAIAHFHSYESPPGRNKHDFVRDRASSIFPMERIVLEMAELKPAHKSGGSMEGATKSSTEDLDTEALWIAALDDFTFFEDEKTAKDKTTSEPSTAKGSASQNTIQEPSDNQIDVVAYLSEYRRERKQAQESFEAPCKDDEQGANVGGFWSGIIEVV